MASIFFIVLGLDSNKLSIAVNRKMKIGQIFCDFFSQDCSHLWIMHDSERNRVQHPAISLMISPLFKTVAMNSGCFCLRVLNLFVSSFFVLHRQTECSCRLVFPRLQPDASQEKLLTGTGVDRGAAATGEWSRDVGFRTGIRKNSFSLRILAIRSINLTNKIEGPHAVIKKNF
jgi:hypothetical protein